MINVLGLVQHDKDVIRESHDILSKKYQFSIENEMVESFTNKLVNTKLVGEYSTVSIKNIFKIQLPGREFYMVSIYLANIRERVAPRVLMYGLAFLNKNMGDIYIRPETLWDKIGDIFNKKDIDFEEHKGFSNKYCFFAEDKGFAKENIPKKFLEEVFLMDKLHFEFCDKIAITTLNRRMTVEDNVRLADFMAKVTPLF
jgi:hypothetical protein